MTNEKEFKKRFDNIEKKLELLAFSDQQLSENAYKVGPDTIDLLKLGRVLWSGKWVAVAITVFFALASCFYSLSLPNIYKSEVLLISSEENSVGLAGLAGRLGGLASFTGVNLDAGSGNKTALAIEVLKSRDFISRFLVKRNLLVPLLAAKGWDRSNDVLEIDPELYDVAAGEWKIASKMGHETVPSIQKAYKAFSRIISVTQDKKTNFIRLGIEYYSPELSKKWVGWLVEDVNKELKARDVEEAKRSIEYLKSQLQKTLIADMKTVFYELIEEQTKTIMFSEARDEYAFKTIDPAIAPEMKYKPRRSVIVFFGSVIGLFFGCVAVIIFSWKNNS